MPKGDQELCVWVLLPARDLPHLRGVLGTGSVFCAYKESHGSSEGQGSIHPDFPATESASHTLVAGRTLLYSMWMRRLGTTRKGLP